MQSGFKLVSKEKIKSIMSEGYIYNHVSGINLVYIKNKDKNRVFSITFKTPPKNNMGVAHILEHSVLAGSKKYPLKDPFNELLKSKLYSYLNAITFKDKTLYPIGSYNEKEFFEIMDVYLDAVFNPLIFTRKGVFLQEGCHCKLDLKGEVSYSGIVYNEMRAVYTDTLYIFKKKSYSALFPNTSYKYDAAGDPNSIIKLTYNDFLNYYNQMYLPQNACLYLYGDLDINKYLTHINSEYLRSYKYNSKNAVNITLQKPLKKPVFLHEKGYGKAERNLSIAFVIGETTNSHLLHGINILAYYLLKFEFSPLRQELIKVAENILFEFDTDLAQPTFFIILKNTKKDINEFKNILYGCIEKLIKNGLDKFFLNTCFNKYEFQLLKEDYGYKPKGLAYNLDIIASFMYGTLSFNSLNKIKILNELKSKSYMFEIFLGKYFLNNTHVAYITLEGENNSKPYISSNKKTLNEIKSEIHTLKKFQHSLDSKNILSKIAPPNISNISTFPEKYTANVQTLKPFKFIHSPINLNGVISLTLCFNIKCVPKELLPYIGLYTVLIGNIGTKNHNHIQVSKKNNRYIGGLVSSVKIYSNYKSKKIESFFQIKLEFMQANMKEVEKLIVDMLLNTNFDDTKHIKQLLIEHKSKMSTYYQNEGHELAKKTVESNFNDEYKKREEVIGFGFYMFLKQISTNCAKMEKNMLRKLKLLNKYLFTKETFLACAISDKILLHKIQSSLNSVYESLPSKKNEIASITFNEFKNTAFITDSNVYYNALGFSFNSKGYKYSGHMEVLATILNTRYLQNEVRIKGGAYGAAIEIYKEGYIILHSYRDPNVDQTFNIFKGICNFLKEFYLSQEEIKKYIVATINLHDKPIHKYKVGERAISNSICDITKYTLLKERKEILETTPEDIMRLCKMIKTSISPYIVSSVGNNNLISKSENYVGHNVAPISI